MVWGGILRQRGKWGFGIILGLFAAIMAWGLLFAVGTLGWADNTVRLVRMEPHGEIRTKTNFTFLFSSDVVSKSRTGKFFTMDKVRFRPEVPGKFRWDNPKRLRFFPEVALKPSTGYTVEIAADLASGLRKTVAGERKVKFTTERFKVTDQNLDFVYNPKRKQGLIFQARVNFNFPVSADSLRRNLKLIFTDNQQPIKFTVRLTGGGREAIVSSGLLIRGAKSRRIELSLPEGFACLGGAIGLKERYAKTADFRERRALSINDITAETESGNRIVIRCSEMADSDDAADFITIKPAVKCRIRFDGEAIMLIGNGLKPGQTYEVRIAKGMPALNGTPLEREYFDQVTFPDLEPSITFNSAGRYLSSRGNLNLGLETVNISQVEVEIAKIYANNIAGFLSRLNEDGRCYSEDLERLGKVISTRKMAVRNRENETVTTPLNLKAYLNDKRKGIFQVSVCDPENRWRQSSKVVIVTDLGILAKFGKDELVIWVNSLDNLEPKAGAKISLVSYNNQEIISGETDAQGVVRFTGMKDLLKDYRSYLILAEQGEDLSFVCLDDSLIEKTDFPVDGRESLIDGYEAFVYTDRGVFRPGEQANVVAVVRGPNATVPEEFPVRMEIVGPDGMIFREYAGNTKNAGVSQFQVAIPDYAKTGKYTANLVVAKEIIGSASFNVEEFMPDRIKVETGLNKDRYFRGDSAEIKVKGVNLFGPPATGRRVDMSVRLEPVPFSPANYKSYSFGDNDRDVRVVEETIGQDQLDMNGLANFTYDFPDNLNPPGMIRAVFQATVTEDGGRAVSNYKAVEYHPRKAYIGLKCGGDYYAKVGENYPILLVEVDPTGKPLGDATIDTEIYSVTWNSIYRRDSEGHYSYHSEREEEKINTESCKLSDGRGTYTFKAKDWGCYKIVFIDRKTGAKNSYEFYATGWGYAPWAMDHPDRIELGLDKTLYKPGETATVQIKAPFSGRAMVTIEREKIYDVKIIELKENTGVVSIPVKDIYKPNVYISVHLIRTTKKLDKRAPARAFGTIPLSLDNSGSQVKLDIEAPEQIRPNQTIEVQLNAAGGGGETYVTLAAVDEGICQLTEFETPNPMGFFYGKRSLGIETYDLYGMLLPEVEPVKLDDSPAGDAAMDNVRRRNLNPVSVRRVKPVSLWSGLVKLDGQGTARVKLAIPQFNGTIRLMAVAVSGSNFGSATKKMLVRDPIVLTSTFPRFMAPGDRVVIPVSVFNGTGKDGEVSLKLTASGPVTIDGDDLKGFAIGDKQERTAHFAVVAKQMVGKCNFRLEAKLNSQTTEETIEMSLRPPQSVTRKTDSGVITAKKPLQTQLKGSWMPGTGQYSLCLAPLPAVKFAGGIRYLLGYPYGCVEQTTSKVFPMLYYSDLARVVDPNFFAGGKPDYFVRQGIEKLESMQTRNGGFSYWPGGDWVSDWGSVYAAHFLIEARKAGYQVHDRVFDRMLDYLAEQGRKRTENSWELQLRVYALYVLSLAGEPQISSMAYVKNQRLGDLYADSRAMLAAAYYYAGDKKTARGLLPNTFAFSAVQREKGGNFNSSVRTDAIILNVLTDMDPSNPAVPKLIQRLAAAADNEYGYWGTTQENAFAFMAMGKFFKQKEGSSYTGEVLVDGEQVATFDSKSTKRISDPRLSKGKITVRINGTGECYYYAETSGVSLSQVPEVDRGMVVRREFFDRFGHHLDLDHVKQGDLIVARILIKTSEDNVDNVAIVDLLPAGLEIENPRLATSSKIDWMSGDTFAPSYMDIRDDRIILFASFSEADTRYFYYALRAVGRGTYTLPPVKAECMYEPEVYSLSSSGTIKVED